jgi:hypothetical protein
LKKKWKEVKIVYRWFALALFGLALTTCAVGKIMEQYAREQARRYEEPVSYWTKSHL